MSGKDTVGARLAKEIDGKFLSSGDIIRDFEAKHNDHMTKNGELIPTNKFYDIVLPFFSSQELAGSPLVLSSIGRWSGEENAVMEYTKEAGHEIKAVVYLQLTENEVRQRWQKAKELGDHDERSDERRTVTGTGPWPMPRPQPGSGSTWKGVCKKTMVSWKRLFP